MRALAPLLVVMLTTVWSAAARAQFQLPGLGGGDKKEATVRLADDPRREVEEERRFLADRQQSLLLRNQDVTTWKKRRTALDARKAELEALRRSLVQSQPPTKRARRWRGRGVEIDEIAPPDAGPPPSDGGMPDGGVPDGGVPDGGLDGGPPPGDGGVGDGGVGDGGVGDGGGGGDGGAVRPRPKRKPREQAIYLPVLPLDEEGFLKPGVHPALVLEIDQLLRGLGALDEAYASLLRMHAEERNQIVAGLAHADELLKQMSSGRAAAIEEDEKAEVASLERAERIALDVHLASIELSLARARNRQSRVHQLGEGDESDVLQALPSLKPLEAEGFEPWTAFLDSFSQAERLRVEHEAVRREVGEVASKLGSLTQQTGATRERRYTLELMLATRTLDQKRASYERVLDRLTLTDEDITRANEIHERSVSLRQKSISAIQQQLDELQAEGITSVVPGQGANFGNARVRQAQKQVLAEELTFERAKLERDTFRRDLVNTLAGMLQGIRPERAFLDKYAVILDAERLQSRFDDLETRCDGWRREQNELRGEKAPPALEANKKQLLKSYAKLADFCMREEWVLGTEQRLAEITRFHLDRLEVETRTFGWYAWRTLVSILLAALLLVVSRWLGAVTRKLAGHADDGKDAGKPTTDTAGNVDAKALLRARLVSLRRYAALALYLGCLAVVWGGATLLAARGVWDAEVEVDVIIGWATTPLFVVQDRPVSAWSLVRLIGWGFVAVWSGRLMQTFVSELLEHFEVDRGVRETVGTISRYFVIAAGFALGLASVGIGLGALAVVFGVIGIGIGFGLQNIASNFISGFIILIERPIRKGDFVQVDQLIGEVKEISARATTLMTRDAVSVIVPNSEFVSGKVINWTLGHNERVRAQVRVGVAYGSDVAKVRRQLLKVAQRHPGVLKWPQPTVDMTGFGDSSLNFVLHVWTERIRTLPGLLSDLNVAVDKAFRESGVEIPFPQRDLHIRSDATKPKPEAPVEGEADEGEGGTPAPDDEG